MRRTALPPTGWWVGLGCASILLSSLCGCSWNDVFSPQPVTLPNSDAIDRALRLCSLSEGNRPFHLILDIGDGPLAAAKPSGSGTANALANATAKPVAVPEMRARVEVFWLSAISYRVEIHSQEFNQIRIVNGAVTEEHDTGDFYPRWIQNFVDAVLEPVPQAARLRRIPGTVPVGLQSHACISSATAGDGQAGKPVRHLEESSVAQVCFQDAEPRIASGVDFTRSVWFDDFAPFGRQEIARTLVNKLPANVLVHGQVTVLEPLRQADYALLKAHEFTLPAKTIRTTLVEQSVAQSMLDASLGANFGSNFGASPNSKHAPLPGENFLSSDVADEPAVDEPAVIKPASFATGTGEGATGGDGRRAAAKGPMTVYIRTDKTGKVREAYRNTGDHFGLTDAEVARAMKLKFKPLIVDGVARQMEAPIILPR